MERGTRTSCSSQRRFFIRVSEPPWKGPSSPFEPLDEAAALARSLPAASQDSGSQSHAGSPSESLSLRHSEIMNVYGGFKPLHFEVISSTLINS